MVAVFASDCSLTLRNSSSRPALAVLQAQNETLQQDLTAYMGQDGTLQSVESLMKAAGGYLTNPEGLGLIRLLRIGEQLNYLQVNLPRFRLFANPIVGVRQIRGQLMTSNANSKCEAF